jgi:hypothetical protein
MIVPGRVTGLGEFSPIGRLFSLGSYFENKNASQILVYFFYC